MAKGSGRGAGAYTGYSKNFVPVKSSKGTKADSVAADVLTRIFGTSGSERIITLKDGRKFKAVLQESGVSGPVGAAIASAGKAAVKAAGGKTSRAVAEDAAKAASRRTAAESQTIRKGTQAGRTANKAVQLEQQAAKESSSKSVNVAPRSPVAPRPSGAEGPKVPAKALDKFVKGRKFADPKKAKADLEEQLRVGARMRAEGRAPGSDVPYRDGSLPAGNPTAAAAKPAAKPRVPKPTAQEEKAAAFAKGLTKPKNPGAKASAEAKAKFQKDLAAYEKRIEGMSSKTKAIDEGRLKVDGTPKGATAKTGAEGPKKPQAPVKEDFSDIRKIGTIGLTTGSRSAAHAAEKTQKAFLAAGYPKDVAAKAGRQASMQFDRGLNRTGFEPIKPYGGKAGAEGPKEPAASTTRVPRNKKYLLDRGATQEQISAINKAKYSNADIAEMLKNGRSIEDIAKQASQQITRVRPYQNLKPAPKTADRQAQASTGAQGSKRELVRVPSTQGRKASGPSSSGSKPIALGSKPFSKSREIAVRKSKMETLNVRPVAPKAAKPKGRFSKTKKTAAALAAVGAAGYAFDKSKNPNKSGNPNAGAEGPKPKPRPTSETLTSRQYADSYKAKSDFNSRSAMNKDVKDGTVRAGRGGRYMRRWNSKSARWEIIANNDERKFRKGKKASSK